MLFIVITALFYACEMDALPDNSIPSSGRRTVLVYLGVDNNFRAEAAEKIEQLKPATGRYWRIYTAIRKKAMLPIQ
ncbi:hypothetical protein AGMMS50239_38420 [Bacteroidia bacterium]|nr:hypothetical protein AGMMS50239_38420 [Bacteroidia bacterium]GHV29573.1 hypothetical protein FACS1894177_00680 [Bacteroidia bacterium]